MSNRLEEIIRAVTANEMREITVERVKQIAIEYAQECCKASLEKASEIVAWKYNDSYKCKQDIINPDNIILF